MTKGFDTGPSTPYDAAAYMKRQYGKFEGYRGEDDEPHPKNRQSLTVKVGEKVDPLSAKEIVGVRERYQASVAALQAELAMERRQNALLVIRTTDKWQQDNHEAELKWRDDEIHILQHEKATLLKTVNTLIETPQGREAIVREAAENMRRVLAGWYREDDLQKAYDQLCAALEMEGGDRE